MSEDLYGDTAGGNFFGPARANGPGGFSLLRRHDGLSLRVQAVDPAEQAEFPLTRQEALALAYSIISFYDEE